MNDIANPVVVEVTRGEMVESCHRGAAAVVNAHGRTVATFGDVERPIFPRSAIKPLQAVALAECGALDRFNLGSREIALACASHSGEPRHTDGVQDSLRKIGLDENALECGAHEPSHQATRELMIRRCEEASPLHNNCSGKHAGFLTVAVQYDEPVGGYIERSHPVQQRVLKLLKELTNEPLDDRPNGIDGCGIPVVGVSLWGVAAAFAKLASGNVESSQRQRAVSRIKEAMAEHPELVGGEDRFCTAVAKATAGRVLVKIGAEGVYAGMLIDGGLGFALKIDDGARRAAEATTGRLIRDWCQLDSETLEILKPRFVPLVENVAKDSIGEIRCSIQY